MPVGTPPSPPADAAGALVRLLMNGHEEIVLDPESRARIIDWLDLNAPLYGTYSWNKDEWRQDAARTGPLTVVEGTPGKSTTEALVLHDADHLFIGLSCAGEAAVEAEAKADGAEYVELLINFCKTRTLASEIRFNVGRSGLPGHETHGWQCQYLQTIMRFRD